MIRITMEEGGKGLLQEILVDGYYQPKTRMLRCSACSRDSEIMVTVEGGYFIQQYCCFNFKARIGNVLGREGRRIG